MSDDNEWKAVWRSLHRNELPGGRNHQIGVYKPWGDALEALLAHFPWIVYLGNSLWRRLLIQVSVPSESQERNQSYERFDAVIPSLLEPATTAEQMGAVGALAEFTRTTLPAQFHPASIWGKIPNSGGDFLLGLMAAEQMDVVRVLVEHLSLDLREAKWRYRRFQFGKLTSCADQTVLHIALLGSPSDKIPLWLLAHGADARMENGYHRTPVHTAAESGLVKTLTLLAQLRGSDTDDAADQLSQPLLAAVGNGHKEVVSVLIDDFGATVHRLGLLHLAASRNDLEMASMLLERYQIAVDERDKVGHTPLIKALFGGKGKYTKEMVTLLCDCGAKDPRALNVVASDGNLEIVTLLIDTYNFDPKCRDIDGNTLIHSACRATTPDVLEMLLSKYPALDVNARNNLLETPLHVETVEGADVEAMKLLLKFRADVNAQDEFGNTKLHAAVCSNGISQVEVLSLLMAQPNIHISLGTENEDGETPRDIAERMNLADVTKILCQKKR